MLSILHTLYYFIVQNTTKVEELPHFIKQLKSWSREKLKCSNLPWLLQLRGCEAGLVTRVCLTQPVLFSSRESHTRCLWVSEGLSYGREGRCVLGSSKEKDLTVSWELCFHWMCCKFPQTTCICMSNSIGKRTLGEEQTEQPYIRCRPEWSVESARTRGLQMGSIPIFLNKETT